MLTVEAGGVHIVVYPVLLDRDGHIAQVCLDAGDFAADLGLKKVRNRNRREDANDGDDDQEFNQRKALSSVHEIAPFASMPRMRVRSAGAFRTRSVFD